MWTVSDMMAFPWFFKGKGKERESKDKQVNGHQFTAGSVLGSTLCEICGKPASGKEVLHCTCELTIFKQSNCHIFNLKRCIVFLATWRYAMSHLIYFCVLEKF